MLIVEAIYMMILALVCVLTAKSDIKEGYIYNRILKCFFIIAIILDVIYYGYFANDLFLSYLMNIVIMVFLSLFLFYSHSFAGGDCKLTIVLSMLYPARFYLNFGNGSLTLFLSLGLAIFMGYIFLFVTSLVSILRKKNKLSMDYVKQYVVAFFKSFIVALIYISAFNLIMEWLYRRGFSVYEWITRLVCVLIAWSVGKFRFLKKRYLFVGVLFFDVVMAFALKMVPVSTQLENYTLVVVLLLCQMTIKTDLYEEVLINDLHPGMILSTFSSVLFQGSRVRGLPGVSLEDLRNRLTAEEVDSIKRWAEGRNIVSVTIVKKIPFAIFLVLGFWCYFFLWGSEVWF